MLINGFKLLFNGCLGLNMYNSSQQATTLQRMMLPTHRHLIFNLLKLLTVLFIFMCWLHHSGLGKMIPLEYSVAF